MSTARPPEAKTAFGADEPGDRVAGDKKDIGGPNLRTLFLFLTPLALLFVLLLRPIFDVDIFWQLRLGEMILHSGELVTKEPFAATHLGEALPPLAWLGQVVLATARLLGGWTGLRIFDAIIWLGGLSAIAFACRRRGAAPSATSLALVIGFVVTLPAAAGSIRPESFAALSFCLLLALLRLELSPARTLMMAAPLLVVWQNLHPSVSVAVIALGATASVAWLRHFLHPGSARPWLLSALTGIAAMSVFATPLGISIIRVAAVNAESSIALGVSEWLPLWAPINRISAWLLILASLFVGFFLVRNRQRINWEELAPAVALFIMTLMVSRFLLFWGIALIPVLARILSAPESPRQKSSRGLLIGPIALAGTISLALFVSPTQFNKSLPLEGIKKLRGTGVTGTVFAHVPWGGAVIDSGYPDWTVAYDGRYYRYTPTEWQRYKQTVRGDVGPKELDQIYHPAAYLLSPEVNHALVAALRAEPETWREVYADSKSVVFIRNKA